MLERQLPSPYLVLPNDARPTGAVRTELCNEDAQRLVERSEHASGKPPERVGNARRASGPSVDAQIPCSGKEASTQILGEGGRGTKVSTTNCLRCASSAPNLSVALKPLGIAVEKRPRAPVFDSSGWHFHRGEPGRTRSILHVVVFARVKLGARTESFIKPAQLREKLSAGRHISATTTVQESIVSP